MGIKLGIGMKIAKIFTPTARDDSKCQIVMKIIAFVSSVVIVKLKLKAVLAEITAERCNAASVLKYHVLIASTSTLKPIIILKVKQYIQLRLSTLQLHIFFGNKPRSQPETVS